ncbi:RNA polymerase sigma-70 factor [Pedobacter sp.]|jgi:RNA polymerase sigma-70 factor (family 1)|uniref:RNA polymerase sigma factor n=1 Tax=Pedobacter sp. TaxID=1411316 RepID=UPI002C4A5E05|nr:RNA polymerase sigma-70 factor [Pedobacter sp.]HWW42847.1 RNA polymerase sigma-70 factor [Pedobacter sp.]
MNHLEGLSDQQLVDLLREGNHAAFTEIYNRYVQELLNHAYNQVRRREEAKDIIHQVFTMLWHKRATIKLSPNLPGVLFTSVRNIVVNQVVRQKVQNKYLESVRHFVSQETVVTDHLIREKQLAEIINKEIALLPPKMREVFELSRKGNLSHKEIAEQLNLSEQTVSKHISNALKILRDKFGVIGVLIWFIQQQ